MVNCKETKLFNQRVELFQKRHEMEDAHVKAVRSVGLISVEETDKEDLEKFRLDLVTWEYRAKGMTDRAEHWLRRIRSGSAKRDAAAAGDDGPAALAEENGDEDGGDGLFVGEGA